ncbi:DUF1237 domain-containing protein [Protomyces lactucae-debilis]|uniref:DUF1237 domain-containing protein n=1 Tax=Protomyces lactucae-debilis TaxID=2754530 RepID=A0A1Y2FDA5_PROLT|nr:DUF1237 domain-containing protein [Protomyces lactucae-debilis]ORY81404.1 DUF1237 domain-containing protein [Protomyces lactucae-debilis]
MHILQGLLALQLSLCHVNALTASSRVSKRSSASASASASASSCPDYNDYSKVSHEPLSSGPLKLAYTRPSKQCRTFHSDAVEQMINQTVAMISNPDIARIFENTVASTLDTTIKYHNNSRSNPQSFVITGDINAEWLRDASFQLTPYYNLVANDSALATLIAGAVQSQAYFVNTSPYCNSFQPFPESGVAPTVNEYGKADVVKPKIDKNKVFECKYEIDSLAAFLRISRMYYEHSQDNSMFTAAWIKAVKNVFSVIAAESRPSFNSSGIFQVPAYTFQRTTDLATETLAILGAGYPVNGNVSMVRSAFRPSDDSTILQYFVPGNAMLSVELGHLSSLLKAAGNQKAIASNVTGLADKAMNLSTSIRNAIYEHAVIEHPIYGKVFAYEIDGYGGRILMDDANMPSLLSLPYLGFVNRTDSVYLNTRKMILSANSNAYYIKGSNMAGIGSIHTPLTNVWPMSLLVQALTSDNETEVSSLITQVANTTNGLGLIHESVNVGNSTDYSRPWFSWANAMFGVAILDIQQRFPSLLKQ